MEIEYRLPIVHEIVDPLLVLIYEFQHNRVDFDDVAEIFKK